MATEIRVNPPLTHYLRALKQVLSSPAVTAVTDAELRGHLQKADRVVGHLLAVDGGARGGSRRSAAVPEGFVEGSRALLRRAGFRPRDRASCMRSPTARIRMPRSTRCCGPCATQHQLYAIASEDARARLQLVAIERRCSERLLKRSKASWLRQTVRRAAARCTPRDRRGEVQRFPRSRFPGGVGRQACGIQLHRRRTLQVHGEDSPRRRPAHTANRRAARRRQQQVRRHLGARRVPTAADPAPPRCQRPSTAGGRRNGALSLALRSCS
jgi:hypothetical protein